MLLYIGSALSPFWRLITYSKLLQLAQPEMLVQYYLLRYRAFYYKSYTYLSKRAFRQRASKLLWIKKIKCKLHDMWYCLKPKLWRIPTITSKKNNLCFSTPKNACFASFAHEQNSKTLTWQLAIFLGRDWRDCGPERSETDCCVSPGRPHYADVYCQYVW